MTCAALIVDNRPRMEAVIAAHKQFLPEDWAIYWVYDKTPSVASYNRFMTSENTWDYMPADKVLIFQHDSALLQHGIEEFLSWDFVGAPIPRIGWPAMNGGLSLRDRRAMLNVIQNIPYNGINEDMYFCNGLKQLGGNLPGYDVARQFSCETEFCLGTLGYHAIDKYMNAELVNQIKNQYNGK